MDPVLVVPKSMPGRDTPDLDPRITGVISAVEAFDDLCLVWIQALDGLRLVHCFPEEYRQMLTMRRGQLIGQQVTYLDDRGTGCPALSFVVAA